MKVAILYPIITGVVEKFASLFPEGLEVVGLPSDTATNNDCVKRLPEWKEVGITNITFNEKPYNEIDFSKYDLLIETAETFFYSKDWINHCQRIECPIVVKVCWTDPGHIPTEYLNKLKNFPLIVEMPAHAITWKKSVFTDVTLLPEPVGDWWFKKEWTGEKEQALFVLAGKDIWRPLDKTCCGIDLWERLCKVFPGRIIHQDGAVAYKTTKQMTELFSESRVFLNLDRPFGSGERPLAVSFTEAVSAGMPVLARDMRGLSYWEFIEGNGICTNDFDEMCAFIEHCFSDRAFAKECSIISRQIGYKNFSFETLRPKYEAVIARAQTAFKERK